PYHAAVALALQLRDSDGRAVDGGGELLPLWRKIGGRRWRLRDLRRRGRLACGWVVRGRIAGRALGALVAAARPQHDQDQAEQRGDQPPRQERFLRIVAHHRSSKSLQSTGGRA